MAYKRTTKRPNRAEGFHEEPTWPRGHFCRACLQPQDAQHSLSWNTRANDLPALGFGFSMRKLTWQDHSSCLRMDFINHRLMLLDFIFFSIVLSLQTLCVSTLFQYFWLCSGSNLSTISFHFYQGRYDFKLNWYEEPEVITRRGKRTHTRAHRKSCALKFKIKKEGEI